MNKFVDILMFYFNIKIYMSILYPGEWIGKTNVCFAPECFQLGLL